MKIGIGLPATIPGVGGDTILEWAKKADAGSFSSLGIIDRLVYPNYEAMITLAAAAGATSRVRLMTTILVAPLRNPGVLAKEAATLDALSAAVSLWGSPWALGRMTFWPPPLPSRTGASGSTCSWP